MANFNQKGPEEKGAKTGRGLGKCNKEKTISELWFEKPEDGNGHHLNHGGNGRGRGNGRGHGRHRCNT